MPVCTCNTVICRDGTQVAAALQALQLMCSNIVARPEEAMFRTIRLLNGPFQQSVARHAGGVEALLAIGFVEAQSLGEEEAVFFVLEEPQLDEDPLGWASWYDGVKASRDTLLALMQTLGVRELPAAAKGTGWSEDTKVTPAQPDGALTLHGQRGGGL
mmetsp:Transcript_78877/g.156818  ORF Transcript_78877/g.156818 Transcript_78877/m.156818 type:complete len:158 (-) Transcript_78877:255-728(-)